MHYNDNNYLVVLCLFLLCFSVQILLFLQIQCNVSYRSSSAMKKCAQSKKLICSFHCAVVMNINLCDLITLICFQHLFCLFVFLCLYCSSFPFFYIFYTLYLYILESTTAHQCFTFSSILLFFWLCYAHYSCNFLKLLSNGKSVSSLVYERSSQF